MEIPGRFKFSAEQKRILWIIYGAFVAAVPIYVFVYFFYFTQMFGEVSPALPPKMATYLFGGISLITTGLGFFLAERFPIKPRSIETVQVRMIITNAFFESVAVYGLIGRILGLPQNVSVALFALSLVALIINGNRVKGWIEESEGGMWSGTQNS
jgi:hypothetical protein